MTLINVNALEGCVRTVAERCVKLVRFHIHVNELEQVRYVSLLTASLSTSVLQDIVLSVTVFHKPLKVNKLASRHQVGNTCISQSGEPGFKSRLEDRLFSGLLCFLLVL